MKLKKLIKYFIFERKNLSKVTLGSDKVRLNIHDNVIQLAETSPNIYSTDDDLFVKTWVTNPESVKQWLGFDVEVIHVRDDSGTNLTSVAFRLSDGTEQYYWNGSSWEVNVIDWNTEAEIAANISSFPVVSRQLQIVINLKTTNQKYTPRISQIKVLFASDIEFQEDIIVRSMIPLLKSEIRPIADYPVKMTAISSTIDLDNFVLETPYNLISIDSVFDHTNDANHMTDLFDSYDSGSNEITLSSSIAADDVAWVRFTYEPEVALSTDQEYTELSKVPQILLDNVNFSNRRKFNGEDAVRNKDAGTAVIIPSPHIEDLNITLRGITASQKDQQRLADSLREFFTENLQVTSRNLDEPYDLWHSDYVMQPSVGQKNTYAGMMIFQIKNVRFYLGQPRDVNLVEDLTLNFEIS